MSYSPTLAAPSQPGHGSAIPNPKGTQQRAGLRGIRVGRGQGGCPVPARALMGNKALPPSGIEQRPAGAATGPVGGDGRGSFSARQQAHLCPQQHRGCSHRAGCIRWALVAGTQNPPFPNTPLPPAALTPRPARPDRGLWSLGPPTPTSKGASWTSHGAPRAGGTGRVQLSGAAGSQPPALGAPGGLGREPGFLQQPEGQAQEAPPPARSISPKLKPFMGKPQGGSTQLRAAATSGWPASPSPMAARGELCGARQVPPRAGSPSWGCATRQPFRSLPRCWTQGAVGQDWGASAERGTFSRPRQR